MPAMTTFPRAARSALRLTRPRPSPAQKAFRTLKQAPSAAASAAKQAAPSKGAVVGLAALTGAAGIALSRRDKLRELFAPDHRPMEHIPTTPSPGIPGRGPSPTRG
jgi:hypothetical protein